MSQHLDSANSTKDSTGSGVYIQVTHVPPGATTPQSVKSSLKKIGPQQLQALGDVVGEVQTWLLQKLTEMSPRPSAFSLEFGIDAEGEAGIPFITKGSIGANFKVSMEWK